MDKSQQGPNDLTVDQAAERLGVKSPETVKNWLCGGHFPGAYRAADGQWYFPVSGVEETEARMAELTRRNREGDLTSPDVDDDLEPPVL